MSSEPVFDLLSRSDAVSNMIYFFAGFIMSAFCSGVFGQIPDYETTPFPLAPTSFTCHGRPPGYYADVQTGCKTYHVCDGNSHFTYLCPRRTLFQQRSRTCDHSYLVLCEGAHLHPDDTEEILRLPTTSEESQTTEGKLGGIYDQTEELFLPERTQFAREESTTLITPTSGVKTTEPFQNSKIEFSTVNSETPSKEDSASQSKEKFLKIRLKDVRSLFFIPEFDDNSVIAKSEMEYILPLEKNNFMKFKTRKEVTGLSSLCPSYCNPKYFLLGTCHPCIMIK